LQVEKKQTIAVAVLGFTLSLFYDIIMMQWQVEALNETVKNELAALPKDMLAYFTRISNLIEQVGLEKVHERYVKHIEGKIWEMRLKGRDGIARSLYVAASGRRVIVLRTFIKKTEKTPRLEIEIAYARMKEIKI